MVQQPKVMQTNENQKDAHAKPKAIFFLSPLGQVGKSTTCKMHIHYLKEVLNQQILVLDMDTMNPNVGKSYAPEYIKAWGGSLVEKTLSSTTKSVSRFRKNGEARIKKVEGEGSEKIATLLSKPSSFDDNSFAVKFLDLLSAGKDLIVNVPGNNYPSLCKFLFSVGGDKSEDFDLYICWVTNGSIDCLNLFVKTQLIFPNAKFLLTFNEGNNVVIPCWDDYCLTSEVEALDREAKIKLASLFYLNAPEDFWHEKQNQPYTEWLTDEKAGKHERNAFKAWIDFSCRSIAESGYY